MLFGIDVDVGELLLAKMIGVDGVIAHHPMGSSARIDCPQVIGRHERQLVEGGIPGSIAHPTMLARRLPERSRHSVITGHRPSDSIGINRVIDVLEQHSIQVVGGLGVIRP